MKRGVYCMEYLVNIVDESMEMKLRDILSSSIPSEPKCKIVQLRVTVEYDENGR